jgi:hypothetical protein
MSDDALRIEAAVSHLIHALENQGISTKGMQISLPKADAMNLMTRMRASDKLGFADRKYEFRWPEFGEIAGVVLVSRDN